MVRLGKRFQKPGTSPGTLRAPEVRRVDEITIQVMDYGPDYLVEKELGSIDEVLAYRDTPANTWINVNGIHDVELLRKLGEYFGFHPLALEDVINTGQRPKVDNYEDHQFIVVKELRWEQALTMEQVSIFLGRKFVITLQETQGDPFGPVRDRIRTGKGRIRKMGPDYLAYALIDAVVDEFFPILEKFGELIEDLESEMGDVPNQDTLSRIHQIKRDLLVLRRAAWPEREVINCLQRDESRLIRKETKVFLRDCYDHTVQIMDIIENYRDLAASLVEVYLSSISNRMNEVIKMLTLVTSVFIPLTFIVGVYGMNFNKEASPWNMPELNWYWGYPAILAAMLVLAVAMLIYFRRKGWW
jgi:magnesium transporter